MKEIRDREVVKISLERGQGFNMERREDLRGQRLEVSDLVASSRMLINKKFPRFPMPDCKICGKKHTGVCNKASIVCFRCN